MSGGTGSGVAAGTATPAAGTNTTGAGVPALPPGVSEPIQALFPTFGARLVGTLLAGVALVLASELVRSSAGPLEEQFDDTRVEVARAGTMVLLAVLVGGFLVVLWGGSETVAAVLDVVAFGEDDVVRTGVTVVLLAVAYALTRVTKRTVRRLGRDRGALSRHQRQIGHHLVQVSIFSLVLLVVLGLWGVNVAGLLVGAGFAGIVVGLAARQTLGALIAGFVVLFSRPFELGDWVRIGDHEGIVPDINIVNTHLRTYDDEFLVVPNDRVTSQEVLNRSRKGRLRVNVDVGVDYDTDLPAAMALAEEAMAGVDLVLEQPPPEVVLPEFGDSSVLLRLRFHIDKPSARRMWEARTAVIAAVKSAFDEAGVTIPYPQRELSARDARARVDLAGADPTGPAGAGGGTSTTSTEPPDAE